MLDNNSINSNDNNDFNDSTDKYSLLLSRTSWYDEMESGNIIGMLVRIIVPKLGKLGITVNKTNILETSYNFISFEQLCEAQNIFNEDINKYDDGRISDKQAIMGNALGNGNAFLPLYINNIHWNLVKTQINFCHILSG